jgi:large subunit ribosomal protein L21e
MRRSKGYRSKTRSLLRKKPRERGKIGLSRILRAYRPGDKVTIIIEPSVHRGMPHRRYHGRVAVVRERRGRGYVVELRLGREMRYLTVRPEHLAFFHSA